MIVKVFIRRQVKEGKERDFFKLLKKMRSVAMNNEGYISGETLMHTDDFRSIMVVSTWQSREYWDRWKASGDRKAIDSQLELLQEAPAAYEPFVFSKYKIAVEKKFPEPLD
jgi:heme-degrading monooxygenase HmoA